MSVEVVAATEADYVALYGHRPPYSMQGYTGRQGGEPAVMAGLYRAAGKNVMFLQTKGQPSPRLVVRVCRAALDLARARGTRIFALRDEALPTADGLLRHFGFQPVGMTTDGEVYQWHRQQ